MPRVTDREILYPDEGLGEDQKLLQKPSPKDVTPRSRFLDLKHKCGIEHIVRAILGSKVTEGCDTEFELRSNISESEESELTLTGMLSELMQEIDLMACEMSEEMKEAKRENTDIIEIIKEVTIWRDGIEERETR
ncbi:hypothetical protein WH47_01197 [Habropoda laboriosa]|uniref:Uncharacterized protein n=1 Tax=Habropoda laboriosa TaxID=597456 RepID=A0A0L7QZ82_9HYME|nr:hypothetical protein WH47_01197 [Habropoda laboriosa]